MIITLPDQSTPSNLTANDLGLTADDFSWNNNADVPSAAGTYSLILNKKGQKAVKDHFANNHNIKWDEGSFTGKASFTINKAQGTIALAGSDSKVFDDQETNQIDGQKFSIMVDGIKHDLQVGQYQIVDAEGNVVHPKDVGTYYVVLTNKALNALEDSNHDWTLTSNGTQFDNQVGTYVINPINATASLGGENSKTYDGVATTVEQINSNGQIKVTLSANGLSSVSYTLQASDYSWLDESRTIINPPKNVGQYLIQLTSTGLTHLQNELDSQFGKDNVILESVLAGTGRASYSISKKHLTITANPNSDSAEKVYDGTAGSITIEQLTNGWKITGLVNGEDLNTSGLSRSDFEWPADLTNVGTSSISLKSESLEKLQADNPNYSFDSVPDFKYIITSAEAVASLSGHGEKTYDGQPVSDAEVQKQDAHNNITVNITYPGLTTSETIQLTADDFDWSPETTSSFMIFARDASTGIPKDDGSYTLSLNSKGEEAIKKHFANNHNIKWDEDSFIGFATYLIKKAEGRIEFNGSDQKVFDNQTTYQLDGQKYSVSVNGKKHELQTGQYKIVDAQGNEVHSKNVGTYHVELTDAGIKALENNNYKWTVSSNGTYKITEATAEPQLSGKNSKVYDGTTVTVEQVNKGGKISVAVTIAGLETVHYTLQSGDYSWFDESGKAIEPPKEVGKYFIKLTAASKSQLQKLMDDMFGKGNVSITSPTGQAEFDITSSGEPGPDHHGDGGNPGGEPDTKPDGNKDKPH